MSRYDAYVLRFWRSNGVDGLQWRCQMVHLGHGDAVEFADLEALLRHVRSIAGEPAWQAGPATQAGGACDDGEAEEERQAGQE